jgi:hypothetical protein
VSGNTARGLTADAIFAELHDAPSPKLPPRLHFKGKPLGLEMRASQNNYVTFFDCSLFYLRACGTRIMSEQGRWGGYVCKTY